MKFMTGLKMNEETIDSRDYHELLQKVIHQAIEDYVKLMHPAYRRKKYLQEAFEDAVDLFFDPYYQLEFIKNDDEQHMDLRQIISEALQIEDPDIDELHSYLVKTAKDFWKKHKVKTIYIPSMLCIEGEVYDIYHDTSITDYVIDTEAKTIQLNKKSERAELLMTRIILELAAIQSDAVIKKQELNKMSSVLFSILKVNDALRHPPKELLVEVQES